MNKCGTPIALLLIGTSSIAGALLVGLVIGFELFRLSEAAIMDAFVMHCEKRSRKATRGASVDVYIA